jgi:hypothetical protein
MIGEPGRPLGGPPESPPTFRVDEVIRYNFDEGRLEVLTDGIVREAMQVRTALAEGVLLEAIVHELRRRGYLVEPPGDGRSVVEAHVTVSGDLWRREPGARASARENVRRRWALELERRGHRPIGWPPVAVRFLRFAELAHASLEGSSWAPADEATADVVHVEVSCEAVPA